MTRAVYCPAEGPSRLTTSFSDATTFPPPSQALLEAWATLAEDTTMVRTPQSFLDSVIAHWADALFSESLIAEGWKLLALRDPRAADLLPFECPNHPEFYDVSNVVAVADVDGQIVAVKCHFRPDRWVATLPSGEGWSGGPEDLTIGGGSVHADPNLRIWWYVIVGEARKLG